ncbi:hypothetical protein B0A50_07541 [Salinomyces thailandicus]|uniref:EKC/KEOPS complex subunit BUD32 n=1 Tax=Salinomyces thailandicus TaxID=706561 RepID=A0A4U0TMX1_9PEZI|nr:hypothetical protein B0A50_07541 [Salinomyces thailandica]
MSSPEIVHRWAKGKFLDSGVSGIVELLPNGHVIKSPWPGHQEADCQADMALEARVYQRLSDLFSTHKRFVRVVEYDEAECALTMQCMTNGTLRAYLEAHNTILSEGQRYRWIHAMTEGLDMLHSANIVHCDFSPRNMLLDDALELKVADFGCVSMDDSKTFGGGSARFYHPKTLSRDRIGIDGDLFALGSSIFEVLTGRPPYADLDTSSVRALYDLQQYPDLQGLKGGDVIRDCWLFQANSARRIYQRVKTVMPLQV